MADIIDNLFLLLMQYMTVEEIQTADILSNAKKAANIMSEYE